MPCILWFILVGFGDLVVDPAVVSLPEVVDPVVVSLPDGEHQLASVDDCIHLDRTPQR